MKNGDGHRTGDSFVMLCHINKTSQAPGHTIIMLSAVSRDYLEYLRHEQGCSEGTLTTYKSWLNIFEKHI